METKSDLMLYVKSALTHNLQIPQLSYFIGFFPGFLMAITGDSDNMYCMFINIYLLLQQMCIIACVIPLW
jgi:hypothetical protein